MSRPDRKRCSCEMSTSVTSVETSKNSNHSNHSSSTNKSIPRQNKQNQESNFEQLTFLCLSKQWRAAAKRATLHPHEAGFGCTSSARRLLPLGDDNDDDEKTHNSTNSFNNNTNAMASSPLALVTRYDAPSSCVKAVLDAETRMVRRCIPNRGTPLHEAIMLFPTPTKLPRVTTTQLDDEELDIEELEPIEEYVKILRMLLKADESLECDGKRSNNSNSSCHKRRKNDQKYCRATLMQDVDGNVPLHLFIRQAFYNYLGRIASSQNQQQQQQAHESGPGRNKHPIFDIAQEIIESSPEAVSIPDCTEFEETPLILALKSSVYANEQHEQQLQFQSDRINGIDYYNATLERNIFDICKIMLQSSPEAASRVMVQNGYTAVHSAVFHGRCSDTIRLLLNADEANRINKYSATRKVKLPASMQANKFGELPLHFATMRGECTRSIALLSQAAPWAVLRRDVKLGLTPMHWLLVRFVDSMDERFGKQIYDVDSDLDQFGEHGDDTKNITSQNEKHEHEHTLFSLAKRQAITSVVTTTSLHEQFHHDNGHIRFDLEYHIRTEAIDPPVQYTRMRHIIPNHSELVDVLTTKMVRVLRRVRDRHSRYMQTMFRMKHTNSQSVKETHSSLDKEINKTMCPFPGKERVDLTMNSSTCPYKHLSSNSTICPYSNGKVSAAGDNKKIQSPNTTSIEIESNTQCPYANAKRSRNGVIHGAVLPEKKSVDDEPRKKCPFRCPFVFDSYPIDEDIMKACETEAIREEQVISLFWAKVTSLLHAAALANILDIDAAPMSSQMIDAIDYSKIHMLHTACSSPCPFPLVRLCVELHPEQVMIHDSDGKLPLHHAALRLIDPREVRPAKHKRSEKQQTIDTSSGSDDEFDDDSNDIINSIASSLQTPQSNCNEIIKNETARVVEFLISTSPRRAAQTLDNQRRLPLHCMIETVMKSAAQFRNHRFKNAIITTESDIAYTPSLHAESFTTIARPLFSIVNAHPDGLECRDGKTNLYPFMQAAAMATESYKLLNSDRCFDSNSLSITFALLLEKPSIMDEIIRCNPELKR